MINNFIEYVDNEDISIALSELDNIAGFGVDFLKG